MSTILETIDRLNELGEIAGFDTQVTIANMEDEAGDTLEIAAFELCNAVYLDAYSTPCWRIKNGNNTVRIVRVF